MTRTPLLAAPLEDRLAPAAGAPDPSFGSGGAVVFPFVAGVTATTPDPTGVAATPDGGAVAVFGYADPGGVWAVRLRADGSPDPTFGAGGKSPAVTFGSSTPPAVAVGPDGRVVIAGTTETASGYTAFTAARLTADGQLDPTFGAGGVASVSVTPYRSQARGLTLLPGGGVLIVGQTGAGDMAAVRLTERGQPDPAFGDGGTVTVPFPVGPYHFAVANAAAVAPDGRLVLAGGAMVDGYGSGVGSPTTPVFFVSVYDVAAVRLTADGRLDPTFGDGGRALVPLDPVTDAKALAARVLPDGRVVLAGTASNQGREEAVAVRLLSTGAPDPGYDGGGSAHAVLSTRRQDSPSEAAVVYPDGRALVAGDDLVRFDPAGRLDPAFGAGGREPAPFSVRREASPADWAELRPTALAVQPDAKLLIVGQLLRAHSDPGLTSIWGGQIVGLVCRLLGDPAPGPLPPAGLATTVVGGTPTGSVLVRTPDTFGGASTGGLTFFPDFGGVVRAFVADVTGDGTPDYVGGAGPGGGPRVAVLDGRTLAPVADFLAFEPAFTGGVFVTAGDVNADGFADVIVTPDLGGGPVVAVYDGALLTAGKNAAAQANRFLGIEDDAFRGGARAAAGDLNGDGRADLVVSAGFLGGPRVAVFDGGGLGAGNTANVHLTPDFFAFEPSLRNGAFVSAADVTGDGVADLAFGAGPGGAPRVRLFDGAKLRAAPAALDAARLADFFSGDPSLRGGAHPLLRDLDGDGKTDLTVGSGEGEPSRLRTYASATLLAGAATPDADGDPFGTTPPLGVFVG